VSDILEQLQELGFSQYEGQAYLSLLQAGKPLSGYEAAKASGVPRPNIYPILQKLEDRGAVLRLDSPEGVRYAPLASGELIRRLREHFHASIEAAEESLAALSRRVEPEHVWNARGYSALLEHARSFIEEAEGQLLLAVWPQEAQALADDMRRASERGVEVTTLCMAGCPQDCGSCRGQIHRYPLLADQPSRWLVLVPDGKEVLAGEIQAAGEALSVRTRQKLLVDLAAGYIRHSIALAALVTDLGEQLDGLLSPQTHAMLDSLHEGEHGDWLQQMRRLLRIEDSGETE
jgi:HTH-type transcriptional regulator, sugar sensing transcriptional regulator